MDCARMRRLPLGRLVERRVVLNGDYLRGATLHCNQYPFAGLHWRRVVEQHYDAVVVVLVEHLRRRQNALPGTNAPRDVDPNYHRTHVIHHVTGRLSGP